MPLERRLSFCDFPHSSLSPSTSDIHSLTRAIYFSLSLSLSLSTASRVNIEQYVEAANIPASYTPRFKRHAVVRVNQCRVAASASSLSHTQVLPVK